MALIAAAVLLANVAMADTDFNKACPDIIACSEHVATLLGQHYLMDNDVKGSAKSVGNLVITKDNAELLFTKMLYLNGFSRVPLGPRDTFEIRRIRDAKDTALPRYNADPRNAPFLPRHWDLVKLTYKAAHPESLPMVSIQIRNATSPTVTVSASPLAGTITIVAPAAELGALYEILKENDVKPSAFALREQERQEERSRAHEAQPAGSKHP